MYPPCKRACTLGQGWRRCRPRYGGGRRDRWGSGGGRGRDLGKCGSRSGLRRGCRGNGRPPAQVLSKTRAEHGPQGICHTLLGRQGLRADRLAVRIYTAGTSSTTLPATTTTSTPSTSTSTTVTTSSTTTTTLVPPPSIPATSSGGQLLLGVFLALTMTVGWALRRERLDEVRQAHPPRSLRRFPAKISSLSLSGIASCSVQRIIGSKLYPSTVRSP